ncbi:hypothetical protein [Sulfitobacter sp.]|uniref:hypothetical protein n=1 Tax=Sulfitobacter sp. TaxID=1903071 RepID=UPI0030021306
MSKPVTNEEVEDVLSSIRRLVSEDKRPLAGLRSAPSEPALVSETERTPEVEVAADPVADRFVLTPALRVAVSQDIADNAPLDLGSVARETWIEPEEAEAADAEPLMLFPTSQQDVAETDEATLAALVHDAVETETQPADDGLEDGDYSDEGYWNEEEQAASDSHEVREDSVSSDIDSSDDDVNWDVDDNETYSSHVEDEEEQTPEVAHEPLDEKFFDSERDVEAEIDSDDAEPSVASIIPLTDKIAALEAAVGEIVQDWEPDGDLENELASTDVPAMTWEDDVELDAKGAPMVDDVDDYPSDIEEEQDAPAAVAPIGSAFGVDDQLMDEEALRDLVSEIVRAELQGALGERITRNVRKLVRREIHRALTAQDME